jgi:hypothetical protein
MKRVNSKSEHNRIDTDHNRLYHWLANQLKVYPEAHISGALTAIGTPSPEVSHVSERVPGLAIHSQPRTTTERLQQPSLNDIHIIMILGVYANPDGTPSAAMQARIDRGYFEALQDPQAKIVVSGAGVGNTHIEAEVMARELLKKGVDETRLIIEPRAQNTISNATRTWLLLPTVVPGPIVVHRITVVTEPYHLVRALRIFSQLLSQVSPRTILRASPSEPLLAPLSRRAGYKLNKAHRAILRLLDRQAVTELCRNVEEKWRISYGW